VPSALKRTASILYSRVNFCRLGFRDRLVAIGHILFPESGAYLCVHETGSSPYITYLPRCIVTTIRVIVPYKGVDDFYVWTQVPRPIRDYTIALARQTLSSEGVVQVVPVTVAYAKRGCRLYHRQRLQQAGLTYRVRGGHSTLFEIHGDATLVPPLELVATFASPTKPGEDPWSLTGGLYHYTVGALQERLERKIPVYCFHAKGNAPFQNCY
jgi:hypothetical protein